MTPQNSSSSRSILKGRSCHPKSQASQRSLQLSLKKQLLIQNKNKNNFPTSDTHLTIQSEFPYQETLANMDALQLLQLIQNKKSHQTSYFSKNNFPTSETHLTIQSEFPYQKTLTIWRHYLYYSQFEIRSHTKLMI